jgi:FixJ family two-component response regulator
MRSSETIVYVISSEPAERKRLTEGFVSQGIEIITFRSAHEFIETARDDRTACLILDLNLPDVNGLELQGELNQSGAPPIIFLTAHTDLVAGVRAIKNGAIDVLVKPVDYNHLWVAVDLAFAQDRQNREERIERMSLLTRWQTLTPREMEVFHHTVAGLLNKQAAAELGIAENTYQVHRGRVMRKMEANSLADLVRMSTKLEPILRCIRQERSDMRSPWSILGKPIGRGVPLRPQSFAQTWAVSRA